MIRPDAPLTTHMVVDCPLCDDKSFTKTIKGQYCIGNIKDSNIVMTDTPTNVVTTDEGTLLQKVHIVTQKRKTEKIKKHE